MKNHLGFVAMTAALLLSSGCVSHTTCLLYTGPNSAQLDINRSTRGLIFGICGPTTRADSGCSFYLPGKKDVYQGSEIQPKGINFGGSPRYEGSISIIRAKKQVEVNLNEAGRPFEFNGTHRYREEFNNALSP
jgi:hypothetical protein